MAAQPFATGGATSVDTTPVTGAGSAADPAAASAASFSADYAMSLLAKITHASADQALALIQGILPEPR